MLRLTFKKYKMNLFSNNYSWIAAVCNDAIAKKREKLDKEPSEINKANEKEEAKASKEKGDVMGNVSKGSFM